MHPSDASPRTPPTTLQLLTRARTAGVGIGKLCDAIHERSGEAGVRRILGVLSLVKKHGARPVEDACQFALEIGFPDSLLDLYAHNAPPAAAR